MQRKLVSWVMGFHIVNDVPVHGKNVQLSAETTDSYCGYQNIGAISKSSQDTE